MHYLFADGPKDPEIFAILLREGVSTFAKTFDLQNTIQWRKKTVHRGTTLKFLDFATRELLGFDCGDKLVGIDF